MNERMPPEMAAALAGGVMLGGGEKLDLPMQAQVMVELQAKLRCEGCGERIETGWTYTYVDAKVQQGQPIAVVQTVVLCDREGCKGQEDLKQVNAICRERMEIEWLGEEPAGARKLLEDAIRSQVAPPGSTSS
jgi:hypothetical protein